MEQRYPANELSCKNTTYPEQIDGEMWVAMKTAYWGRAEYWVPFENKQTTPKNITAGVFYLGNYSHELKREGIGTSPQPYYEVLTQEDLGRKIAWPSRPTSMTLNYIFLPKEDDDNRDRGYIFVGVYGEDTNGAEVEIAKGEVYLDPFSGKRETATPLTIKLDYSRTDVKATKIDVFFSSSEHYRKEDSPACNGNTYTGNILKIKDVRLNYEK
ncbi:MAG: hypothetical protein K2K83_04960 [Rikenella sp.]|nr:hypothetical protein [Rikenella sp.]